MSVDCNYVPIILKGFEKRKSTVKGTSFYSNTHFWNPIMHDFSFIVGARYKYLFLLIDKLSTTSNLTTIYKINNCAFVNRQLEVLSNLKVTEKLSLWL